jgi:hypothetical protein
MASAESKRWLKVGLAVLILGIVVVSIGNAKIQADSESSGTTPTEMVPAATIPAETEGGQ